MRIQIKISRSSILLPFNYQESLVGALHKWLGKNMVHDTLSLYSLSWLNGGAVRNGGLIIDNGATWNISAHDPQMIKKLIEGITEYPDINYGMKVQEVLIQSEPIFKNPQQFFLDSPIFIKRTIEGRIKYFLFDNPESNNLMTETIKNKLTKAGLFSENVRIEFDNTYPKPISKLVIYKGIKCKASLCPVIIFGSQEQIAFAWNVGLGNSTGIGFGALK